MPPVPHRLAFPRWGSLAYELFDNAAFLFILATVGYLLSDPPTTNRDALALVYGVLPAWGWGLGLSSVAAASMICACRAAWVRRGMVLLQAACVFWALCFAVGSVLYVALYAPPASWIAGLLTAGLLSGVLAVRRHPPMRVILIASGVGAITMFAWASFYETSLIRVVISITLYFWIASRLARDLDRLDAETSLRAYLADLR